MPHNARTSRILDLTALVLECRSSLLSVGLTPTTGELLDFTRLVWMREAEARRMEFMDRDRSEVR
jgi:hypothetical protein